MIKVHFSTVPGTPTEFYLNDNATVKDLFEAIKASTENFDFAGTINVGGCSADEGTLLREGSFVTLARKVKGNQVLVRIVKMPGATIPVTVNEGTTIAEAIQTAKDHPTVIDGQQLSLGETEGFTVKLNGVDAQLTDVIPHNGRDQMVILTKKVKGNR